MKPFKSWLTEKPKTTVCLAIVLIAVLVIAFGREDAREMLGVVWAWFTQAAGGV